jgi:biotin/methionine sulfoxide reductase
VLTFDVGTSRLTQGPSALSALVEVERWDRAESLAPLAPPAVTTTAA